MSSGSPQYEFTRDQNTLIGSLAYKMRWVGLFLVVVGVLQLIMSLLLVAAIYKEKVPSTWTDKMPPEVKSQVDEQVKQLPANNNLWGMVIGAAVNGMINLLMGVWTRAAGASFKQIVDTQGRDISWLMKALESLHSQYSLIYTILVIGLVLTLSAIAIGIYGHYFG